MLSPAVARVVLGCGDLSASVDFFGDLGFGLDSIWPADDPVHAIVSRSGLCVELRRDLRPAATRLVVPTPEVELGGQRVVTGPDGTIVELVSMSSVIDIPTGAASVVVSHPEDGAWITGRAGMRYRDLLPDRWGGRYVASHIEITEAGPVPDYAHFHDVRFQMIFCANGWARLVYEDQGEPFVINAGDCVLQPPRIRHRVLEAGGGLEVVEIGCPAEHLTSQDHDIELPSAQLRPGRAYGGQRFVRYVAATAGSPGDGGPWLAAGFVCRDTGIAAATGGVADVRVGRPGDGGGDDLDAPGEWLTHDDDLLLLFVLAGAVTLDTANEPPARLARAGSVAVPARVAFRFGAATADLELLQVTVNP